MPTTLTKSSRKRSPRVSEKVRAFLDENAPYSDREAARLYLRQRALDDFWFFQHYVYGNEDTATQLHIDMCERWAKRKDVRFSLWLIPRSHLKTSIWTEAGTLWELCNNPDLRFLIVNAKLENAVAILNNIHSCVKTNEVFRWLFPEMCYDLAPKTLRSRCKIGVERLDFPCSRYAGKKEGNIEVMGVEASLVSKHYDRIVFDDPVNDVNTTTKNYRDKIERWYRNALQLRHDANSVIRLIGTRWHFDDLYSRLLKIERKRRKLQKANGEKVVPRYWIYHRQVVEKVGLNGERIAGYDDVVPIWPERFTKENIEEIRSENGSYIFSCQYMNNPLPEEDAVFKYSDIDLPDEYDIPEAVVTFIATDTAVEDTEKGDFWVITVASFDQAGKMYVRECVRDKLLPSTFLQKVHELTEKWDARKVGIETTAYQKTMAKVYRERAAAKGWRIPWTEMSRGKTSKLKRILSLQPRVERGDFAIEDGIRNQDWILEEMTTYPRSPFDDILDTLADLEAIYYKAPQHQEDMTPQDSWDAYHGPLDAEEEDYSMSCSVITEAA